MANFRVVNKTAILPAPNITLPRVGILEPDQTIQGEPAAKFGGFVETHLPDLANGSVFIFRGDLAPVAPPVPEPISPDEVDGFCALVTWAARDQAADRDYLMAVAYSLSDGLRDFGPDGTDAVGPFKFSTAEWAAATTGGPAAGLGMTGENRYRWECQPMVAARLAAAWAGKLAAALGAGHPTRSELFFAQCFGTGAEAVLAQDRARRCSDLVTGTPPVGSFAAVLKAGANTLGDVLKELQAKLDKGYAAAKPVIDRQPDEVRLAFPAEQGVPPWLALARAEMRKGVAEIPGSVDSEEIKAYHTAAGLVGKGDGTAWCGSFVTFCMLTCGDAGAAEDAGIPNPALAASWKTFGKAAPDPPPVGAIVVLRKQAPDSSGHVGFLEEGSDLRMVRLLAGNQRGVGGPVDRVGVVPFAAGEVVAVRVPKGGVPSGVGTGAQPQANGVLKLDRFKGQQLAMAQKIAAAFGAAGFGANQQAAAIANAFRESGLDPTKRNFSPPREDSVGLFQFNRIRGEGTGHSVEELSDPDRNIGLTIGILTKRIPAFGRATTLRQAVSVFVHDFERPKDAEGEVAKRLPVAQSLLA